MTLPALPAFSRRIVETPSSAPVRLADVAMALREQGRKIYDFSAGRASEPTPAHICAAAKRALDEGDTHQTMAQGTTAYRRACARKLARDNGVVADPDRHLIATMGTKQGLMLALMALLDPGDEVIVEDPCFVSYQPEIRFCGGRAVEVPLRAEQGFRWTYDELLAAVTPRTRAILSCNPHNPTGVVLTETQLDVIARVALERGLYVISDEIYERMPWGGRRHVSMASRPGMADRTVTLMGTTKGFAMGGWRIGFNHAPEPVIRAMIVIQQHMQTSASSIAQAGATVAFGDDYPPALTDLWADWEHRCMRVAAEVNTIPGIRCAVPEGGFYAWIDIRSLNQSSEALAERLLREQGIALVPGSAFGRNGEGFLRMTCVKSWPDLEEGLVRLRRGLA